MTEFIMWHAACHAPDKSGAEPIAADQNRRGDPCGRPCLIYRRGVINEGEGKPRPYKRNLFVGHGKNYFSPMIFLTYSGRANEPMCISRL